VTAGWKHNAAITASGELLTWGWGGSAGTQVCMFNRCASVSHLPFQMLAMVARQGSHRVLSIIGHPVFLSSILSRLRSRQWAQINRAPPAVGIRLGLVDRRAAGAR
jgi:Regulator of chromosome condensation (RCC1) repeat